MSGEITMFAISFSGSFFGTLTVFVANYYLHKKQIRELEKLKKSIQNTVRRLKEK